MCKGLSSTTTSVTIRVLTHLHHARSGKTTCRINKIDAYAHTGSQITNLLTSVVLQTAVSVCKSSREKYLTSLHVSYLFELYAKANVSGTTLLIYPHRSVGSCIAFARLQKAQTYLANRR